MTTGGREEGGADPGGARRWLGLVGWLALSFLAAAVGAVGTADAPEFYQGLERPPWAPPAAVFGPVWTVLYALIGVAAWQVWQESGRTGAKTALVLFGVQLAANALWSWLFFAWRLGGLAFLEILILLGLIAATAVAFWRVRRTAGGLMVPYLLWVGYAAALTGSVWRRNPGVLG